jgi:peptidyl-prolyl cis-trans isomerase C
MRHLLLIASPFLAAAAVAQTAPPAQPAKAAQGPRTLVEVNGTPINEAHFLVFAAERPQTPPQALKDPQAQAVIMNELVNTVLMSQDAVKDKLDKNPNVAAAVEIARRKVLAQAAILNHLRSHPIKDEDVKKAYDAKYGKGPVREYKVRNIVSKSEADAQAVLKELGAGKKFSELAKEKSVASNAGEGGDLGWISAEQVIKPIGDAVSKLEKGAHTKAPLQTQAGWMLLELEDARDAAPPSFEQAKAAISAELQRDTVAAYVNSLRKAGKLAVADGQSRPAPAKQEAKPAAKPAAPKKSAEDMIAPKK